MGGDQAIPAPLWIETLARGHDLVSALYGRQPRLKSPEQLRLVRCASDKRIHLDRYLCKVVLDQDIVLAVKADIQLRLAYPADLRFSFL